MSIVNLATASVCMLYGVYIYRVLRRAEYHDLHWLARRWRGRRPDKNSGVPSDLQSNQKEEGHD